MTIKFFIILGFIALVFYIALKDHKKDSGAGYGKSSGKKGRGSNDAGDLAASLNKAAESMERATMEQQIDRLSSKYGGSAQGASSRSTKLSRTF